MANLNILLENIDLTLVDDYDALLEVDDCDALLELDTSIIISGTESLPIYTGSYEVTPLPYTEQLLPTTQTHVTDDIVVKEIPYYETTNDAGGYTVIIG